MGTGVSRQGNVRKKVLAVNAFEEAGKRHRRKRYGGKKSSSTAQNDPANDPQDTPVSPLQQKTHWAKIKERSILQSELQSRANLKLSDFSKVVRKRTLSKEDEQPIDIPYFTKEKVEPDELCHVCSVYTGRETYPCRICYKVYHESCLRKLGQCNDPASSVLLKRALKPVGWSCQDCDDLSNLLTEEEIFTLYEALDKHNVTQDSNVSIEDYLNYRRCIFKESFNTEIPKEQLQEEIARFHRIDRDNSGSITWWEFINYESINILKKRSKNSILQLLSPREIDLVRILFRTYDEHGTGNIAEYNARKAIAAFYTLFLECDENLNGFAVMSMNKHEELAFVLNETLSFTMDCEADESRKMSWKDFLWELCIYIIAARPNLSQVPVEGSEWTKGVVVSTEMDCDLKRTTL